jgi:hypothetical protein
MGIYNFEYRSDVRPDGTIPRDERTGRYLESKKETGLRRNHPQYLRRSLDRLVIMADVEKLPVEKEAVLDLLQTVWSLLPDPQRECILKWCCD